MDCLGRVVRFNEKYVFFEFENKEGNEDTGYVYTEDVYYYNKDHEKRYLSRKYSLKDISRYISKGTSLSCEIKKEYSKELTFLDNREEMGEYGMVTISKEVKLKPNWYTKKAKICSEEDLNKKLKRKRDYDPEAPRPSKISKDDSDKIDEKCHDNKAKIMYLKRPINRTGNESIKIVTGVMEVVSGKHIGNQISFSNHNLYVWGHNMKMADLQYYFKYGDEFFCELIDNNESTVIKKAFLGDISTNPISPSESSSFSKWLGSRAMDYEKFKRWSSDKLSRKQFFPLSAESFEGKHISFHKDKYSDSFFGIMEIMYKDNPNTLIVYDSNDLYIHDVNIGNTDPRLFIRKGDKLSCQLQPIPCNDKRRFSKAVDIESLDINFMADIVYNEIKRPKSATIRSHESPNMIEVLKSMEISHEMFDKMYRGIVNLRDDSKKEENRSNLKMSSFQTNNSEPMTSDEILSAKSLTAKAMLIPSSEDATRIENLLTSNKDVRIAIHLSKVLTQGLVKAMQREMQHKLHSNFSKDFQATCDTQMLQINTAESQLLKPGEDSKNEESSQYSYAYAQGTHLINPVTGLPFINPYAEQQANAMLYNASYYSNVDSTKAIALTKKLEELESQENASEKENVIKKKEGASKKMKKMFESFKATKKTTESEGSKSKVSEEKKLSPVEILRGFIREKKEIKIEDKMMIFGDVSYPKDLETNFKVSRQTEYEPENYILYSIYFFIENSNLDYNDYLRKSFMENVPAIRKQDCKEIMEFMTGKTIDHYNIQDTEVDNDHHQTKEKNGKSKTQSSRKKSRWNASEISEDLYDPTEPTSSPPSSSDFNYHHPKSPDEYSQHNVEYVNHKGNNSRNKDSRKEYSHSSYDRSSRKYDDGDSRHGNGNSYSHKSRWN